MAHTRPNVWQLQSRRDTHGLISALAYPDPEIRQRAATALRALDTVQAVPALKAALRHETNEQTRHSLAAAIHELDHRTDVGGLVNARDVNGLIKTLRSRHPQNVIAAAHALGKLGDRMAVEPLVILFHNAAAPPAVRLAAAEALLDLQSAPAVVTLLGALRRDSWQVRRNAAAVLGQIQAVWAVEPLAAALHDSHPVVRRTAAAALRRIGTADAIATLRKHFAPAPTAETTPQTPASTPQQPAIPHEATPRPVMPPAPHPRMKSALPAARPTASGTPETTGAASAFSQPDPVPERRDTLPEATPQLKRPQSAPPPPLEKEQTSGIVQPVKKLIAFLKQRSNSK
ncbi:MAG: HEAT repeat domain-containing protein [Anaerolineae bacterium]|nr:HEAT repeat domain-containing protein [Anaerolineae bacterium]